MRKNGKAVPAGFGRGRGGISCGSYAKIRLSAALPPAINIAISARFYVPNALKLPPFIWRTFSVQSTGSENVGVERTGFGVTATIAVHRYAATTPEFLWNFGTRRAWENVCSGDIGGGKATGIQHSLEKWLVSGVLAPWPDRQQVSRDPHASTPDAIASSFGSFYFLPPIRRPARDLTPSAGAKDSLPFT